MRRFSAVFAMILFMIGATLASAQTTGGSEVLDPGGHTLTWSGNWTKDVDASVATIDLEGLLMQGDEMTFGTVVYANTLSGAELRDVFVNSFSTTLGNYTSIDSGSDGGVHYELGSGATVTLYAVFVDGGLGGQSVGYFVVAPTATFANAIKTIQTDFKLDGGMVMNGVDGAGLQQRVTGGAGTTTNTTTGAVTNPSTTQPATNTGVAQVPSTTTGTTAQQPSQRVISDTVTVGAVQIGWTGNWTFDGNSMPEQATFSQVDQASGALKLVSYGSFADATLPNTAAAMDIYTDAFFEGAGAANVSMLDSGVLANGLEWRLYRFTIQGVDMATFITGGQDASGAFVITTVTGNALALPVTLIEVQEQFSVNATASLLDGVDPILVTLTLLG